MQTNKFLNLLILMLLMLCVSTSISAESVVSFSDVTENHWAYTAIMNMTERGMFKGTSEAIDGVAAFSPDKTMLATVYKGNIIKNLIMDCQSYTKYRPNETTGGIFVSWRRKEELPTGA